ncbi:MAG: AAA family ATPase [Candidatus Bathyarchaeia archaeon]
MSEIIAPNEQPVNANVNGKHTNLPDPASKLIVNKDALLTFIENLVEERGGKVYHEKGWAIMRCPFHDDNHPSLAVNLENGRFHCKACGETGTVIKLVQGGYGIERTEAVNLLKRLGVLKQAKPQQEAVYYYYYPTENAELAYRKKKLRHADGSKSFVYEHYDYDKEVWVAGKPKDCPPLLYNYHDAIIKARKENLPVFFVEGEKDVETLKALGFLATTSGGANDWSTELAGEFAGLHVTLIPDNDQAGREWLLKVGQDLSAFAKSVYWIELSEEAVKLGFELKKGGDITDFLELLGYPNGDKGKYLEVIKKFNLKPFNLGEIRKNQQAEELKSFERFLKLEDLKGKDLDFLFDGFLPYGYAVVLSGEAGVGKTWLAYGLVKQAIKQGVKVVYLDADNSLPYIKQTLEDFDLLKELRENFFILSRQKAEISISKDNSDWKAVKRLLKNIDKCLVVVDTLGSFSRGYDPNSDKDMREIMSELKEIRDMGHAVLVLHHTQKYASFDENMPVETKYRGSAVIKADADGLYFVQRDGNSYLLYAGKLRFMGSPLVKITLTTEGVKIEKSSHEAKEEREAKKLLELMTEGQEYTQAELIEECKLKLGYGKNKVLRLLKILQDKNLIKVEKNKKAKGQGFVYIRVKTEGGEKDEIPF